MYTLYTPMQLYKHYYICILGLYLREVVGAGDKAQAGCQLPHHAPSAKLTPKSTPYPHSMWNCIAFHNFIQLHMRI